MRPVRDVRLQVGTTVLLFVIAGLVGGVVWRLLVTLPTYTRTVDNGAMDAVQLSAGVAIDGWYAVIAAVVGFLLATGLTLWTARSARLNVLLVVLGGAMAGLVMLEVGRLLSPGDLEGRLAAAKVGESVAVPLVPNADTISVLGLSVPVIFMIWPLAALAGVAVTLLCGRAPGPDLDPPATQRSHAHS